VGERLGLPDSRRRDVLPLPAGPAGRPGRIAEVFHIRQRPFQNFEDAGRPEDLQAVPGRIGSGVAYRGEAGPRSAWHAERGVDLIAGERADPFVSGGDVAGGDGASLLQDLCEAPLRMAAEGADQVEHVCSEDPQIFSSAALVLLAAGPVLENGSELPLGN